MSEDSWRRGMVILVGVLAVAVCAWLFTVGPWGLWHWHEVARQQVSPMGAPGEMLNLAKGPYASTAPFSLHGRKVRVTFTDLSGKGGMVAFGIWRADAGPGSALGAGIAAGTSRSFTLIGHESGRYRLFLNSARAVTLSVSESRDRPWLAFAVAAGFVAAIIAWVLAGRRQGYSRRPAPGRP